MFSFVKNFVKYSFVGILSVTILFVIIIPASLSLLGYQWMHSGTIVGEIAAGKDDIGLCSKVISYIPLSPPTSIAQAICIRKYAEVKKDPSACELLMPSSYGLSCIGVAENSQMPCNTNVKPYSVYWRDGDRENTVHIRECLTDNVKRTELGKQCCDVARVAYLANENDCSSLKHNPIVHDRCLYSLAWKLKEPSYCNDIVNENARAACSVQTKAIKNNPSFCPGCVTPLEGIDQLK